MRALAIVLLVASVSCKREEKVAARADPEAKKGSTPAAIVIHKKTPRVESSFADGPAMRRFGATSPFAS